MSILINENGQIIGFACGRKTQNVAQKVTPNSGPAQPALFPSNANIKLTAENGMLVVLSPYHLDYLNDFKNRIPAKSRKWDISRKVWLVSPEYAETVKDLIVTWFGQTLELPELKATNEKFETILKAVYVANCATNTGFSNVHCNGGWNAKIPETVLRKFFNNYATETDTSTYYAMLGINEQAKEIEIKSAYRRASRQWHPDVCKEENAAEMFMQINSAYKLLTDPEQKAQYDAGLYFEKMSKGRIPSRTQKPNGYTSFVPMLRCGYLVVTGHYEVGNIVVDELHKWEDITNEHGQTMVSSWDGEKPAIIWV